MAGLTPPRTRPPVRPATGHSHNRTDQRNAEGFGHSCKRLRKSTQDHYDVPSLNTIRQAQQILVAEGLLRTEQGRGVFVVAHPDLAAIPDPDRHAAALTAIDQTMRLLSTARTALTAEIPS